MTEVEIYEKQVKKLYLNRLSSLMSQVRLTETCGCEAAKIVYKYYIEHQCCSAEDRIFAERLLTSMIEGRNKSLDHGTALANDLACELATIIANDGTTVHTSGLLHDIHGRRMVSDDFLNQLRKLKKNRQKK